MTVDTARASDLDGKIVNACLGQVATQAQEYIAGRKTVNESEILAVISTSRSGNYVIEELESAVMEQDTVVLTLDALRDQIENEGRVAIYGIYFDTGGSTVQSDSADALATVVQYCEIIRSSFSTW